MARGSGGGSSFAKAVRGFIWLGLVSGCVIGVIALIVAGQGPFALALAITSVFTWVGWAKLSGYLFGVRRHILGRLRIAPDNAEVITHKLTRRLRADIQMALNELVQRDPENALIFGMGYNASLAQIIRNNAEPTPFEWEQFPSGPGKVMRCPRCALYLVRHQGQPICVMIHPADATDQFASRRSRLRSSTTFELEVVAASRAVGESALAEILDLSRSQSVYRGQVLSFERPGPTDSDQGEPFVIRFSDMPQIGRERIILPDEVMQVVHRNVLGLLQHREVLRRAGRGTRHGVLFHGPPGTGKTLVTKYLARAVPGYTVILLTGRHLRFVRESCQLARMLAPSMVIMEDVDLVASERRKNRNTTILHELMDEMDGLGSKADCIFLLTTNRPDILEPALAARPGRVDQAIEFPLPDADARRRLFELFSQGLYLASVDLDDLQARTEGASPAFIEELFRKAALLAAERGETASPLPLTDTDFRQALRELVEFGGAITRNLLGFQSPRGGGKGDQS